MESSVWGSEQWLRRDPEEWMSFPGQCVMADEGKQRADRPRSKASMSKERPFDLWLQKQLHAMYDEVASEPLPNDLLNLIDRDAAEAGDGSGQAETASRRIKK